MPQNIFVLSGAGSRPKADLAHFAVLKAFVRDPEAVLAFYDQRRRNLLNARPNAAHLALARLEDALAKRGRRLTLVTQTSMTCMNPRVRRASPTAWRASESALRRLPGGSPLAR